MEKLKEFRKEIDLIDKEIRDLLIKRLNSVEKIGDFKRENCIEIEDKNREEEVLNQLTLGLDNKQKEYIVSIYKKIIDASKNAQK